LSSNQLDAAHASKRKMKGLTVVRQIAAKTRVWVFALFMKRSAMFREHVSTKRSMAGWRVALAIKCALFLISLSSAARLAAQAPASRLQERRDQETLKVITEEVIVPVVARNERGAADPTLEADDVLLLENGVPQRIRSLRRIPADVLLLFDTSVGPNSAKDPATTRAVALRLLAQLRADDRVAIMQSNDRVEILQDWTTDKKAAAQIITQRLFSGRSSRLAEAIRVAAEYLAKSSSLNRHLVLFTDGAKTPSGRLFDETLASRLVQTGTTVHYVDYSEIGRKEIEKREAIIRSRGQSRVPEEVIRELPSQAQPIYRTPGGITIDLNRQQRKRLEEYKKAMQTGAARLRALAAETGGLAPAPASVEEMFVRAEEVARDITAQYIITYAPRRPLDSAPEGERRRIEVAPRRAGLQLKARRAYIYVARKSG